VPDLDIALIHRLADIPRQQWDELVGDEGSPFLEWDWLSALEESGCATSTTGWAPHHLVVREGTDLIAAVPMYLKSHSQGEFVFDHGWAEAAYKARIDYYPKLLAAVPFTPAAGRRLLTHPGRERTPLLRILAQSLVQICTANGISSLHVNFCAEDEIEPLREAGCLHRKGVQYQWRNLGFTSFDDYLSRFNHKRRNQVKRERRDVAQAGVEIEVLEGEAIADDLFQPMYRIYRSTVDKMYWGRRYLNVKLFERLRQRWKQRLCFVAARQAGELIAGAICVQKGGVLYGRYWGCFRDIRHLHFDVCYYTGIEHCIARRFERFEPGAGGEFKYWRGFDPAVTHSMHFLAHPGFAQAVEGFLERERAYVGDVVSELNERSAMRKG
jgi:uncharacterized protein